MTQTHCGHDPAEINTEGTTRYCRACEREAEEQLTPHPLLSQVVFHGDPTEPEWPESERDELLAEVERLREALQALYDAGQRVWPFNGGADCGQHDHWFDALRQAREALGNADETAPASAGSGDMPMGLAGDDYCPGCGGIGEHTRRDRCAFSPRDERTAEGR